MTANPKHKFRNKFKKKYKVDDIKMITKEEKQIQSMRNRRRLPGIAASLFLLIMMSAVLAFTIHLSNKVDALVTPERISTMASFENPKNELPELFSRFHTLAGISAKLMFYTHFFACLIGFLLGLLIIQISDIKNPRLLLSMWDRIKELEKQVQTLKNGQQSNLDDSL